jgi:hypothetical protein
LVLPPSAVDHSTFPVGSNSVTKALAEALGLKAEAWAPAVGKSVDWVVPTTKVSPEASTAMPCPWV